MTRAERAVVAAATTVAFWPVWTWYAARARDGADEKWGLLAVLCSGVVAVVARGRARPLDPPLAPLAALAVLHAALALLGWPALLRAIPALAAVALLVSASAFGRRLHAGTAALLLLGLPLEATLQFYAGYPLRVLATYLSAGLLRVFGLGVHAADTLLLWKGEAVGVDPPCSGIHMLWVGLFLAAFVAAMRDFGVARTALTVVLAAAVVIPANGLRVAGLFLKEARVVALPDWTHAAFGAAVFGGVVLAILTMTAWLERGRFRRYRPLPERSLRADQPPCAIHRNRRSLAVYVVACLLVASVTVLPRRGPGRSFSSAFPGWPDTLDGRPLAPVPPVPGDERFTRGFPGRFARFTDGDRAVLLRWMPGPSRQLHTAADCFRGAGYTTRPQPVRIGSRGERWGCVEASRQGLSFLICERIFDQRGRSWTDPSSWWWAAALGRAAGPYWAITVVEPAS